MIPQHQRRMFRGRGGPTDRNLPKHQARRRRRPPRPTPMAAAENSDSEGNLYGLQSTSTPLDGNHFFPGADLSNSSGEDASGETDSAIPEDYNHNHNHNDNVDNHTAHHNHDYPNHNDDDDDNADNDDNDNHSDNDEYPINIAMLHQTHVDAEIANLLLPLTNHQMQQQPPQQQQQQKQTITDAQISVSLRKEMTHLRQRIANTQTGFRSITMADLDTYQTNVLNACLNCVNEWRHILRYYGETTMTSADSRRGGQWLFELIQASLQCGPLSGAKPGYFKRCGSAAAVSVHAYLVKICGATVADTSAALAWTEKQAATSEAWKRRAWQAANVESSVEPSKSVKANITAARYKKENKQAKRAAKKKQLGIISS